MKITAIVFIILLGGIIFYTWLQGTQTFYLAWKNSFKQLLSFAPILVMAIIMAAFVETILPQDFVKNWLSNESGLRGILLAWGAGILTPGGGIVGMPLVAVLYKSGASLPVLMTYLTSLVTLSFIRIPIEASFYGWKITLLRISVSLVLPLIAGGLTYLLMKIYQIE